MTCAPFAVSLAALVAGLALVAAMFAGDAAAAPMAADAGAVVSPRASSTSSAALVSSSPSALRVGPSVFARPADESIAVHDGPAASFEVVGFLSRDSDIVLGCWEAGSAVSGPRGRSTVWYAAGAGWISAALLDEQSSRPLTEACRVEFPVQQQARVSSPEGLAYEWALGRLNKREEANPLSSLSWSLNWVAVAYGRNSSGYSDVDEMWQAFRLAGLTRTSGLPPMGTLVFFSPSFANGGRGQVGIATGDGRIITTPLDADGRVGIRLSEWTGAPCLGWSYVPEEWRAART